MKKLLERRMIPWTLLGLALLLAVLLILLPPERTLGSIIKAVYLHGALVQAGLVVFTAGGLLGLACLIWKKEALYRWCLAVQKTGVIVWVVYALSSMLATYLAWGVAIAWGEPRVQASAKILGAGIGFLILTLWVDNRWFAVLANVAMAVLAWVLTQGAMAVRHPLDPIGSSESVLFKVFFLAILAVVLAMAVQVARWLRQPPLERKRSCG